MSWPSWSATPAPIPTAMTAPVQSTLMSTAINSAPSVMPPGLQYSPEQWAQAQQQNWQQWAQWQQQYQQWHQQYGAEYQKSMSAIQNTMPVAQPPLPTMPNTGVPPPLPAESKPPLPPEDPPVAQPSTMISSYSTMPPKPAQQTGYTTAPPPHVAPQTNVGMGQTPSQANDPYGAQRQNWQSSQPNINNKRPYNQGTEYENAKRPLLDRPNQWPNQKQNQWPNQATQNASYHTQPPPQAHPKPNIEELSEAEKKFDKEFAAWEAQFNKWKDQNANHPDKTQYLEYEKKWESWRNSLLERREQMRRKRLAMVAAAGGSKPTFVQAPTSQQVTPDISRAPPDISRAPPDVSRAPPDVSRAPPDVSRAPPDVSRAPPSIAQHQQPTLLQRQSPTEAQVQKPSLTDNLIGKPPPHQNNEPLSFKQPSKGNFPNEEVPEAAGDGFLKSSSTSGGIPGLDLVKEDETTEAKKEDVIDLDNEERADEKQEEPSPPKGPDLDAISKGINTILGDQKLLSMLSMVSQNPPSAPPPNVATDSMSNINPSVEHNFSAPPPPQQYAEGNFNAPPPPHQFSEAPPPANYPYNDHSNHSFEERSNQGDNYQQRESVNNFDDQTRSSFTMGPNDQDPSFAGTAYSRNQNSKFPPARFGLEPDRANRGNFGPGGPNFASNPMDNRNKFAPNLNRGDVGPNRPANMPQESGAFNQGGNFGRSDFNRGNVMNRNDNFNRNDGYGNLGKGDNRQNDQFPTENKFGHNDGFNRSGNNFMHDNFRGGLDDRRGNNNFDDRRGNNNFDDRRGNFSGGNLNRSDNFNQRSGYNDKFGPGGNYNKPDYDDYENYNEEDDFEKYHSMFNEDEDNHDEPPQNFGRQSGTMDKGTPSRMMDQRAGPRMMGHGGPPPRMMDQGGPAQRMFDQGPPMRGMDRGPPPRTMDQGAPRGADKSQQMRGMDKGQQIRGMDQGPPMRGMDNGPPMRGVGHGPPPRGVDQGPPMRGVDRGPPMRGIDQGGLPIRGLDQGPPMRGIDQGGPLMRSLDQGPPMRGLDQSGNIRNMEQDPPSEMMDVPPPVIIPEVPAQEDAIFEPVTVIDYEHKSQRVSEPEVVLEPINMFDYRHKLLNRIPLPQRPRWLSEAVKFIREFDPLASRAILNFERPPPLEKYSRDMRRDGWQPDIVEERYGPRGRDYYEERNRRYPDNFDRMERRPFNRDESRFDRGDNDDRGRHRHGDGDRHGRRKSDDDMPEPDALSGDRNKDNFEELSDEDLNDFETGEVKKHQENRIERSSSRSPILSNPPNPAQISNITMIEDIINPPGRFNRPPRIVIILRGPPGSGKTYLAKLIKDKEMESGGSAPRILSLDDYFMVEHEKEVMEDGKMVKVKEMVYEYEAEMEESYRLSFVKFFKKTITDGYFPFIIVDNVNDKVKYFGEMWSFAKQNGFQVYICQMDLDPVLCTKRNVHNRNEAEIEECIAGWEPTPSHHPTIDASGLLQASTISEVEMEEVEQQPEETKPEEAAEDEVRSKWDTFDCASNNLAKLDGVSKPLRSSRTMEEYLQLEDDWEESKSAKPGQKRVRWADLEEQREQKKMRELGFIVGHTNWDRMMDPTEGGSALTQTKYFDRVGHY